MEQRTVFKIFLSAPSDVQEDVAHAKNYIIDSLRGYWNDFQFDVIDFNDFPSHIINKRPQEVVNSNIKSHGVDIYIGLMWKTFGTPTGCFGSGTQEEFETSLSEYVSSGLPHMAFLFKPVKITLDETDDEILTSWIDVKHFRDNCVGNRGLYKPYQTKLDLEKEIKLILDAFIKQYKSAKNFQSHEAALVENSDRTGLPKLNESIFTEWLDSPGRALTNGIKAGLTLSDIYVSPKLLAEETLKPPKHEVEQLAEPVELSNDFNELSNYSIFVGGEGIGKTTILKKIFGAANLQGKVPVFFNCDDISSSKFHDIPSFINREFQEQYNTEGAVDFSQIPKDKRVVLIDNFDEIGINDKGKAKLINDLKSQYEYVFITMDSEFYSSRFDYSIFQHNDVGNFDVFEIQEFDWSQIRKITTNWVRVGQEFDVSEESEQNQIETYVSLLRDILGFNYVPRCPLIILISLLGISGGEEVHEMRHPSFARYYEFLLSRHLFIALPNKWIEPAYELFSYIANHLFQNDSDRIATNSIKDILVQFCEVRDLALEAIEGVYSSAVSGGVIVETSEGCRFRYNYAFYYFLTKYWTDHLTDAEIDKMVSELSDNLHLKRSASILVFLAYQNRHECIIRLLQKQLGETLGQEIEYDFASEQSVRLTNLIDESPRLLLDNSGSQRDSLIKSEEESDKNINQLEPSRSKISDEEEDFISDFIITIRRIEVSGQLLKCHAVSIDASTKFQLFENSVNLGLRLLNSLFSNIFNDPEYLVSMVHHHLKDEMDEDEIKRRVFMLASSILAGHMNLWSRYLGANMLEITANKVASSNQGSIAHQLVKLAINLNTKKRLQDIGLSDALKVSHDNRVAMTVLKMLVWRRLVMRPKDDRADRQSVCDTLGITIKGRQKLLNQHRPTKH